MTCIFNLSAKPVSVDLPGTVAPVLHQAADINGTKLDLGGNGFMIGRRT